eukprot:286903-Amphidinium_carterae.1
MAESSNCLTPLRMDPQNSICFWPSICLMMMCPGSPIADNHAVGPGATSARRKSAPADSRKAECICHTSVKISALLLQESRKRQPWAKSST